MKSKEPNFDSIIAKDLFAGFYANNGFREIIFRRLRINEMLFAQDKNYNCIASCMRHSISYANLNL